MRWVLLGLLVGLPAVASDLEYETATYGGVFDACYTAAETREDRQACVGQMSEACMEGEEGGYSTLGMSSCTRAETIMWDGALNAEYKSTMAAMKAADKDEAEYFPGYAKRVESLRDVQRAWIPFRDASCSFAYALWGSGSMRNTEYAGCMLEMTSQRTIELIDIKGFYQ